MLIQAGVAKGAIETLDECILSRLARLNEVQPGSGSTTPEEHRFARQFAAVITNQGLRQRSAASNFIKELR